MELHLVANGPRCVVLALLAATMASAAAVPVPQLRAYASASDSGDPVSEQVTSSGFATLTRAGSYSGYGMERAAFASAWVTFGKVSLESSASSTESGATSGASGEFSDSLTITAPGMAKGTPGLFDFRIAVQGLLLAQGSASARWNLSYGVSTFGWAILGEGLVWGSKGGGSSGDPFGGVYDTVPHLFKYGEPFTLVVQFSVSTSSGSSGTDSASALFGDTMTWQGLRVLDYQTQLPVDDFTVSAASGTDFRQPIPEPASALLLAVGLIGVALRRAGACRLVAGGSQPAFLPV